MITDHGSVVKSKDFYVMRFNSYRCLSASTYIYMYRTSTPSSYYHSHHKKITHLGESLSYYKLKLTDIYKILTLPAAGQIFDFEPYVQVGIPIYTVVCTRNTYKIPAEIRLQYESTCLCRCMYVCTCM